MNDLLSKPKEVIEVFADHCVFMRSVYLHGCVLFETSSAAEKEMMSRAAHVFFGDLNRILVEFLIQQVCNITDPASDCRKNENFTVEFLLQQYGFGAGSETLREKLDMLSAKLKNFRTRLLPARNKLISHMDRAAILAGEALGAASQSDWDEFWLNLEDLVSTIHEKVVGTRFEISSVGNLTDADGLLKALRHGAWFDQLAHGADPAIARKCADLALSPWAS